MARTDSKTPIGKAKPLAGSRVAHVIGVISGKGGVGKTFTASYLAVLFRRLGRKVAVLDADVTGASIPTAFGINDVRMYADGKGIYPAVTLTGIQVASANMLIDHPSDPVIWRGPMAANLVMRFFTEVAYDADIMVIDCPPGTSDIQLSLMQRLPLDGLVLAVTPQGLVSTIAQKAVKMAQLLDIPVLGAVMDMAYVDCPRCRTRIYPFGEPDLAELKAAGIPLLAQVPFEARISDYTDHGTVEKLQVPYLDGLAQGLLDYLARGGRYDGRRD